MQGAAPDPLQMTPGNPVTALAVRRAQGRQDRGTKPVRKRKDFRWLASCRAGAAILRDREEGLSPNHRAAGWAPPDPVACSCPTWANSKEAAEC